jgi:predicted MFS family arabinose efflux permease
MTPSFRLDSQERTVRLRYLLQLRIVRTHAAEIVSMRFASRQTKGVVAVLGTAQTIAWASTYYLPAILAAPIAADLALSTVTVFAAFSLAMVISALIGPWSGRVIDRKGGREMLLVSNVLFIAGLVLLAMAKGPMVLFLAWVVIGIGMGIGLYESAFSTLASIYGKAARAPITGITLIAGFASTVGWPLTALAEAQFGWRGACLIWALIHLLLAMPLNFLLPGGGADARDVGDDVSATVEIQPESSAAPPRYTVPVLSFVFAIGWFCSTSMAAHLPRLLEAFGATTAVAVAAGALIGPAQVAARLVEFSLLRRFHPLVSSRLATIAHPLGAAVLMLLGAPAAYAFTLLHGAGNGVLTIAKGTLPLALFGPVNYGHLQGIISAPGRVLQAFAPLLFGFALDVMGARAIWLTAGLSLLAFMALASLNVRAPDKESRRP